jgi:hypothetical protein
LVLEPFFGSLVVEFAGTSQQEHDVHFGVCPLGIVELRKEPGQFQQNGNTGTIRISTKSELLN